MAYKVLSGVKMLAVALMTEGRIAVFDDELKEISRIAISEESGLRALTSRGGMIYAANCFTGGVAKLSIKTGKVRQQRVCSYPTAIAACKKGVCVACGETDAVYLLDNNLRLCRMISAGGFPIDASCGDGVLCVTYLFSKKIVLHSDTDLSVIGEIATEGFPNCAVKTNGGIYTAYTEEGYFSQGSVAVYDMNGKQRASAAAGAMPSAITVGGSELFCANTGSDTVGVYDIETLEQKAMLCAEEMPSGLAFYAGSLYVSCKSGYIVKFTDGKRSAQVKCAGEPHGIIHMAQ